MKKRELLNATISHVSYVNKAANKKKFFLTKSEGDVNLTFEKEVKIIKGEDEAQKLVYGVVYEPEVLDAHGDFMNAAEIEKAAHTFMTEYRQIDKQHNFTAGAGELVESYVAPADMTVNEQVITKGSWVIVTKATDEIWEAIEKGDITGYSMGGVAEVVEIEKQEEETLLARITKAVSGILKGEVKDNFDSSRKRRDFRTAFDLFENVWWNEFWKDDPNTFDVERMKSAATDLIEILQTVINSENIFKALGGEEGLTQLKERDFTPVEKAGKKVSADRLAKLKTAQSAINDALADIESASTKTSEGEESTVKKEELQEVLKEALGPVSERLDKLEKGETEPVKKEEETPAEQPLTADVVKSLFTEALAPIQKRLDTVEKARGIQKSEQHVEKEEIEKEEDKPVDNFWKGLL